MLPELAAWARSIGTDTKTHSLLTALDIGFEQMASTGAQRKALIFTESRRTQIYLKDYLEANGYAGQVVQFSGTNNNPEATAIYETASMPTKAQDALPVPEISISAPH